jgi:hypothetical protein
MIMKDIQINILEYEKLKGTRIASIFKDRDV